MDNRASIATLLAGLDAKTPGGFAIGLHISYSGPAFLFQTFPIDWVNFYADKSLQLTDPAVAWSFAQTGFVRWSTLAENDPGNVIGLARDHGMTYGATLAVAHRGTRSVLGCARSDREYLDAELAEIEGDLLSLHKATAGMARLSPEDVEALTRMSIRMSHR